MITTHLQEVYLKEYVLINHLLHDFQYPNLCQINLYYLLQHRILPVDSPHFYETQNYMMHYRLSTTLAYLI